MNNVLHQVTQYMAVLDAVYKDASYTSIFESSEAIFDGKRYVKFPKVDVRGAGDYDRTKGYPDGGTRVEWQTHELEFDRGTTITLDAVDNDEQGFDLFRTSVLEYTRTREIPEMDAIRFARIVENAETTKTQTITAANVLAEFDDAEQFMTDAEVGNAGKVLFVSSEVYKALKNNDKINRRLDVTQNNGNINRNVTLLDGQTPVIVVPKGRFWEKIKLLNARDAGQEAGGFTPADGAKPINFIYMTVNSAEAFTKRRVPKVLTPETHPTLDAYSFMIRAHHDLIVRDNKKVSIYASLKG